MTFSYHSDTILSAQTCSHPSRLSPSDCLETGRKVVREKQLKLNPKQTIELLRNYEKNRYPNAIVKAWIANDIGISTQRVNTWFRHQRARERKQLASKYMIIYNCASRLYTYLGR